MPRSERHKRWQLTENNPNYDKSEMIERLSKIGTPTYVIACGEVGESGTKHNHAFVVYENAISMTSLKKAFERAHLEPCKGSNLANVEYIKKQGDFVESGVCPLAVDVEKRDIAKDVFQLLASGLSPFEICERDAELIDYVLKHYKSLLEMYEHDVCGVSSSVRRRRR